MGSKFYKAFTLVELLVVISIIAMLLSIMMPSLQKARENAKSVVCMSNLRSIGISLIVYTSEHNEMLPPGAVCIESNSRNGNGHLYWSDVALEESDETGNNFAAMRPPKGIINCPSKKYVSVDVRGKHDWGKYGYGWNIDYFGYAPSQIYKGWGTKITNVKDPTTIIVGDNADFHPKPVWAQPATILPAVTELIDYETKRHKSGGNYLGVDGKVEHLTWKTIFEDRDARHTGLTRSWSGGYDRVVNSRFTPDRD